MSSSYTSCLPRGGLPACDGHGCEYYPAPVITFPAQQPLSAAAALSDELQHGQDVTIVHGTYYQFNGANFLMLGEEDYLTFTTDPRFPLSGLFQFRFLKYPAVGSLLNADGTVPYQSPGLTIREGDFLMLESVGATRMVTQIHAPNSYNLPFAAVPMRDSILDFQSYGSQSPENVRLISDTFDPRVPAALQPAVRLDGSKAYYIQFTRTGQNLALYPGQTPAPCLVKTSEYKGDGTRWLILPLTWHYGLAPGQAVPQAFVRRRAERPEEREEGFRGAAPAPGTIGAFIAQERRAAAGFGLGAPSQFAQVGAPAPAPAPPGAPPGAAGAGTAGGSV